MATLSDPSENSPCFNIVHHLGYPRSAMTLDGIKVFRQEKIYVPDMLEEILCAPYDDHFIYEEPTKKRGRWSHMCTCGSPAVIVERQGYKRDSSLTGKMFICHFHGLYGKHQTAFLNSHQGR